MTRHRLKSAPAKAVALAAAFLVASFLVAFMVLGLGAGPAQAAPEWHARTAASVDLRPAIVLAAGSSVAAGTAGVAESAGVGESGQPVASSAAKSAKPFPVGFIIGGVLVIIGFAGGVYGQMLRRRGRRPPGS
jgi:hypothetical protein